MRLERRIRLLTISVGALLAIAAGWMALMRAGGSLVTLSYDLPFLFHRAGGTDNLRIVYLDEFEGDFLDRKGQAALLDKLGEAGARAVLYDVIFDRKLSDPKVDADFAAALRRFRGGDENGKPVPDRAPRTVLLACGRKLIDQAGVIGEQLIVPTDQLLSAADDLGVVPIVHDDSYTVRELPAGTTDEPSITWKMALSQGAKLEDAHRLEPRWINYAGPPPHPEDPDSIPTIRACTARNVMDGAEPGLFRDKVVIIGGKPGIVGAAAGVDLFATPFHRLDRRGTLPLMSGVEIQANILSNLLRGNWLTRSSHTFDLALVIIAGLLSGIGLTRVRPLRGLAAALASAVILTLTGVLTVHYGSAWFPWCVVAFLQIPVALVWGMASHFYVEHFFRLKLTTEQRQLRAAFAKYLSPQMLDRLTAEGFRTKVGGKKVMAAMMFTDIESFTEMCQRVRDPQRIVETLNDYFRRTTGHIFEHDGVIIKFIGDAIFAAWGAPLADAEAPLKAARAAWRLSQSDHLTVDGVELKTRIGVHFGEVVAGNIGTEQHVDYTLIGDAVNLASRLEGLNKVLDTHILISDTVAAQLGAEFRTRRVGKFKVKGRSEITEVHELLGPALQEEEPEWLAAYHQALTALESGDREQARALFTAADTGHGRYRDGPSLFFLKMLDKNEPMPGGVVTMDEK